MDIKAIYLGWFHRYPARFSYDVLTQMIEGVFRRLGRKPFNILDPFAGTGATLSAACQLGIQSIGKELSYLGYLISKVRINPPDDLEETLLFAENLINQKRTSSANNCNPELKEWIGEINASKLHFYTKEINRLKDTKQKNWLILALSSSLRPCSNWLPGSIKPQTDPNRCYSDISVFFLKFARQLKRDCETEGKLLKLNFRPEIHLGDCRNLELENDSVEAVITSPPYWSMYDYFDVHRLSYLAFKWEAPHTLLIGRKFGIEKDGAGFIAPAFMKKWYSSAFDGENTVKGRSLRDYLQKMEQHLAEVYRVLKKGGVISYAIANSTQKQRRFALAEALSDLIRKRSFIDVEIVPRRLTSKRILPAGRDPLSGRFDGSSAPAINECIVFGRK